MNTIAKRAVTLTVAETENLIAILSRAASAEWSHAGRTKSAAIRAHCQTQGTLARDLEAVLVRRLYEQAGDLDDVSERCGACGEATSSTHHRLDCPRGAEPIDPRRV